MRRERGVTQLQLAERLNLPRLVSDTTRGSLLEAAHLLWDRQASWNRRAWKYAVSRLLPVKNASWLEAGEAPVDAWEFRRRASLDLIDIFPDRVFRFVFDDGDLFRGHFFELCGSPAWGFDEAFVQH